ncbi:hydrolase [Bradyrhizobium aeschynomenes]|uniref:hydrolase n=1 Tax=Bradyrhizobium aeschynomenes TaxID=2734909 RepID=UPI00155676C3|nr:hydrolase [Bradyrhizobium aeschynomenes]NPV23004.1 hydrolase [Bradyrhizobium aeschynomenes]
MKDQRQPGQSPPPNPTRRYVTTVLAASALAGYLPPIGLVHAARPFGASMRLQDLADLQRDNPERILLPFDLRYNAAFKLARLEQERPEVIWISTSRAGTFRAALFAPYRFYNLSFTAWTTGQTLDLFERATQRQRPRIAILSLDHFLFADRWEEWFAITRKMHYDHPLTYLRSSLLDFARTATRRPAPFKDYVGTQSAFVGTQSIVQQEGFRNDGSYRYSPGHVADARSRFMNAATLADTLPRAAGLSSSLKQPIAQLAEMARSRDVKLMGIQLPFIRAGIDLLDREQYGPRGFGAWREFATAQTRDWLRQLGIPLFDLARLPMKDENSSFVDAYHLADTGAAEVMLHLLSDPDFRDAFPNIDPARIAGDLADIARR